MSDVTRILSAIQRDDENAADKLLPLVYRELRQLAADKLSREKPGQTIQATVLVHEVWLRLVGSDVDVHWNGRGHFFGAAARAMQRILVESARRKKSLKAGGDHRRVELSQVAAEVRGRGVNVLDVDEALQKLEVSDPRKAELVRLRFFAGLTLAEAARALGSLTQLLTMTGLTPRRCSRWKWLIRIDPKKIWKFRMGDWVFPDSISH